jgi:hypothetical protein
MRIHAHTHTCIHTYWYAFSCSPARAALPLAPPPSAARRGGRGHSQFLQVGPVDRFRQRRELGVVRVPARHQCGRPERIWPTPNARRSAPASPRRARARRSSPRTAARPRHLQRGAALSFAWDSGTAMRARKAAGAGAGRTVPPRACSCRATPGPPSPSCP